MPTTDREKGLVAIILAGAASFGFSWVIWAALGGHDLFRPEFPYESMIGKVVDYPTLFALCVAVVKSTIRVIGGIWLVGQLYIWSQQYLEKMRPVALTWPWVFWDVVTSLAPSLTLLITVLSVFVSGLYPGWWFLFAGFITLLVLDALRADWSNLQVLWNKIFG